MSNRKEKIALYYGGDHDAARKQAQNFRNDGHTVLLLDAREFAGTREQVERIEFAEDVADTLADRIANAYEKNPTEAGDEADAAEFIGDPRARNAAGLGDTTVRIPEDYQDLTWQKLTSLANKFRGQDADPVRNKAEALEILDREFAEQSKRDEADKKAKEDADRAQAEQTGKPGGAPTEK